MRFMSGGVGQISCIGVYIHIYTFFFTWGSGLRVYRVAGLVQGLRMAHKDSIKARGLLLSSCGS